MIAPALLACAVSVSPVTMAAVVQVESADNPYALNINHLAGPQPHPTSAAEAIALARGYIARGFRVDMGLAHVAAGGSILTECYARAVPIYHEEQASLRAALRCHNTGDFTRGQT